MQHGRKTPQKTSRSKTSNQNKPKESLSSGGGVSVSVRSERERKHGKKAWHEGKRMPIMAYPNPWSIGAAAGYFWGRAHRHSTNTHTHTLRQTGDQKREKKLEKIMASQRKCLFLFRGDWERAQRKLWFCELAQDGWERVLMGEEGIDDN